MHTHYAHTYTHGGGGKNHAPIYIYKKENQIGVQKSTGLSSISMSGLNSTIKLALKLELIVFFYNIICRFNNYSV